MIFERELLEDEYPELFNGITYLNEIARSTMNDECLWQSLQRVAPFETNHEGIKVINEIDERKCDFLMRMEYHRQMTFSGDHDEGCCIQRERPKDLEHGGTCA
jgi:hypothetical protein